MGGSPKHILPNKAYLLEDQKDLMDAELANYMLIVMYN